MVTQAQERQLLETAKVIAVVGYSNDPTRTSYQIGKFLKQVGYTVYPVNPSVSEIDGEKVYATLADVPKPIDIVNVFRRSEYLSGVVDEAIAVQAKAVWAQLGVFDNDAAAKAEAAGLTMVMDTCIKVSYNQLMR
ncbi:MAG: CoA-binding protein [Chloroflexi bacterium]|uniref:CoA-binding protein n=1 Tax=Candidatus Flexifilum breve TaxID=3140694 RepID=UPI0031376CC1|nr:CoA-binding protein [Chloroflexota bacterium]